MGVNYIALAIGSSLKCPIAIASLLRKDMLEMRPTILLNRLDDALHDAFLASLAGAHHPPLSAYLESLGTHWALNTIGINVTNKAY